MASFSAVAALAAQTTAAQSAPAPAMLDPNAPVGMATLKVCLRLEDESPFLGAALVRVIPDQGNELLGINGDGQGEYLFSGITSGKYTVEVTSPGFRGLQMITQIDGGPRQKTLFVPMLQDGVTIDLLARSDQPAPSQPKLVTEPSPETAGGENGRALLSKSSAATAAGHTAPAADSEPDPAGGGAEPPPAPALAKPNAGPDFWEPHLIETAVPTVAPGVACPSEQLLAGVGRRMAEFVKTLERFTAIEKLDHYSVDRNGNRKAPETRSFPYVVSVSQNSLGTFLLEEFRNGTTDADQFPAHTATRGSPAMALIFHPKLAGGFDFRCEGMGQWDGHPAWQVHFVQRADKPVQIRSYSVDGRTFPVYLEGRVWIDPGHEQVLRLESELVKPIPEIALTREHFAIDYKPVEFKSTGQKIWLPQVAELYVERKNKRFYRRHEYTDFRLFNVDSAQNIKAPGESFSFTNTSDRDISGELTVTRRDESFGAPVVVRFTVPAHQKVYKVVGVGKDVDMRVSEVGAATFTHEGDSGAVKVDSHLLTETSLDVIPQTKMPPSQP
ncbi:MAG TPA: carboxypeptidase-like regulatory domain-containing protein [Candidatus Acidoferrum sp.]|nr:carboxypeptidase-like regulatory domain-containing protein [Candidatus Acidoferrum sp.]